MADKDQPKATNQNKPEKNNRLNAYARFSSIAFQMFAIIGIGAFLGVKLDDYLNNGNKLYTIIFSLLSVIIAIVFVIRSIIANSNDNK